MRASRSLFASVLAVLVVLSLAAAPGAATDGPSPTPDRTGIDQLLAADLPDPAIGIATFPGRTPTGADVAALRGLGLEVQAMEHLPLAILRGDPAVMVEAVRRGVAFDVYPDEQLEYLDQESSASMNAPQVWEELGFDGTGVGVAIIDTGVDATHPDLADRVTHNVKMLGSEYVTEYEDHGSIVVPVDQGPYNNSDSASGHGTHVAGIVAADGSDEAHDPPLKGVAPGADIIGYSTGDALFIFEIIATFDHIIEMKDEWNIDVTNNSWGSGYKPYDPLHPINLATKAVTDAGILNVFAAGNSTDEMQINPWSVAPWIVSVGSTTTSKERSGFSSGGLMFDNSHPVELDGSKHIRYEGDRIGLYHPDVSAPGSDIRSTGTPTGVGTLSPAQPGGTAMMSGTSMATPHVAGLAALILDAAPELSPKQVQEVMEVTAVPMRDGSPFWHSGYGFVDAKAALDLVTSPEFVNAPQQTLDRMHRDIERRVQRARTHRVLVTDHWWFDALPASAFGSDTRTFTVEVTEETEALRGTASYPGDLDLVGINLLFEWLLTLKDADGKVVAESDYSGSSGLSWFQVDLSEIEGGVTYGEWTLEVSGIASANDPAWYGQQVEVALAQLEEQEAQGGAGPRFEPKGIKATFFAGDGDATGATTPEGCEQEDSAADGTLVGRAPVDATCQSGLSGYAINYGAGVPVEFTSEPLAEDLTVGGPATLVFYLTEPAQPAWSAAFATGPSYQLDAVGPDGEVIAIGGGDTPESGEVGPTPARNQHEVVIPPTEIPAGYQLRLRLNFSGFYTSDMRFVYGGGEFADAGLVLTTGTITGG